VTRPDRGRLVSAAAAGLLCLGVAVLASQALVPRDVSASIVPKLSLSPEPLPSVSPTTHPEWIPAKCADGAITSATVADIPDSGPSLLISGWIQPCAATESTNGYAIIHYSQSFGLRGNLQQYSSLTAPTPFDLRVPHLDGVPPIQGEVTAVCLAFAYYGRVACIGIDRTDPGLPAAVPISVNDPRVLLPVKTETLYPIDPNCGTCA
jgi:hypothetical protein